MSWILDGSKMQPSQYQYISAGWHKFKVTDMRKTDDKDWSYEVEVECVAGSEKGKKQIIRIWDNSLFILGNIILACGFKVPESRFKLDPNKVIGRGFWALCSDRPSKDDPEKVYTQFSRFEPLSFSPPATSDEGSTAARKPAKAKPAPAAADDDEEIEEIAAEDLDG